MRVLAIDGGGSKTDVLVCDLDGRVLGRARGPGTNHQTCGGVDEAMRRLDALVRAAGVTEPVELAAVYLAGADLPVELAMLTSAVESAGWATKSIVDNDTLAVLRAGTAAAEAVAVVCGTGINCVARAGDRTVRFPALGPLSGDWGGGPEIGALALWHACRAEDGRGEPTTLATAVPAHFGLTSAAEVATTAHLDPAFALRLDELAPVVFALADPPFPTTDTHPPRAEVDPVARSIVVRQGEEVVAFARAALRRLGLDRATVVLGGGVLRARNPVLMEVVAAGLAGSELVVVDEPPVVGAALLGLDALGATAAAERQLRTGLDP